MTRTELEGILRKYLSWKSRIDTEELRTDFSEVRYLPEFRKFEDDPMVNWSGKLYIRVRPRRTGPLQELSFPVVEINFFRRKIDAVRYVLESFSGGKSPEEIVLEMEAAGA